MSVSISPARRGQEMEITELLAVQLREHGITISNQEILGAVNGVFTDESRGAFLTAETDGRVIGIAYISFVWALEHGGKSGWLEELYVLPEHRSNGLGQRILQAALLLAKESGCNALDLEVDADHKRVESIYLRNGFLHHARGRWYKVLR